MRGLDTTLTELTHDMWLTAMETYLQLTASRMRSKVPSPIRTSCATVLVRHEQTKTCSDKQLNN